MQTRTITTDEDRKTGLFQYYIDDNPTGIPADRPITASTGDIESIVQLCGLDGIVEHDREYIHVTVCE